MQHSAVSVAITNWNGRHYLADCLTAVFAQSHAPDEVLLVDNASTDGSRDLVAERFPQVVIIALEENLGPCPARNAGLEAARNELVLAIDNDAILAKDCLKELLGGLTQPDVAVVHPRSVFDGDRDFIHYDGASMHFVGMMTLHNFYQRRSEATQERRYLDAAISVALLMRKSLVLEVGAYDPKHFILFEDHDLSYRLRMAGWKIIHEPGALVFHRQGTAGISFRQKNEYSGQRVRFHSRNRWIVILKNHGWRAILLGLPGLMVYEAAYLFFAIKNGCLRSWLQGKWDLLQLLPSIFAERRRVQKQRKIPDRELLQAAPLTISPLIERKGFVAFVQRGMDYFFALWWRLVRNLT